MHRFFLGAALLAACTTSSAFAAGKTMALPTDVSSGIKIEIESWLDACPPAGMASFVWRVTNGSNAAHDWNLTVGDGYNANLTTTFNLRVDAGRTVELPFVATAGVSTTGNSYRTMNFAAGGYGTRGSSAQLQQPDGLTRASHATSTPFLAMSSQLSAKGWSELSDKFDKTSGSSGGIGFDASQADLSRAPDDWRGFSGLSQLWMTGGEWSAMGAGAKAAMLDWISLGGRVVLFTTNSSDERLAGLKLPPPGAHGERRIGAGEIIQMRWNGQVFPLDDAYQLATRLPGDSISTRLANYGKTWNLRDAVAVPSLRALLIFGFIVAFGVLVGPVNLYWFAGPNRRQRLFWTTPLISVLGSVLLVALMILQDGIGGSGARRVLALMLPGQNKLALVQEQISRTGVLLGRSFPIEEPSWMQHVPVDSTSSMGNLGRQLAENDQRLRSGDWFTNRSVQAHLIEAVRPSRGHIEFFPGKSDADVPSVLSSLGAALAQVYVVDEQHRYWHAEDVGTGDKQDMKPSSQSEYQSWLRSAALNEMGPIPAAVLTSIADQPGQAYATSPEAAKFAVTTLHSIRWNDDRVLFAGPYVKR